MSVQPTVRRPWLRRGIIWRRLRCWLPVYAHRYLPAGRGNFGHPVLSMWQTDIICYGVDLADYMHREFDEVRGEVDESRNPRATIRFWRDLL
ncbi:hypothetical protein M2158_009656 [Streptomyces sp. SAI-144]|nr:hypothetical protein [Streptomyces sp. SAI-144]